MRLDETLYFFDSHGNPWETCEPTWHAAEAFGPVGAARRLGLTQCPRQPDFDGTGLVVYDEATGFDILLGEVRMSNGQVHWNQTTGRYVIGGEGSFRTGFIRHVGSPHYEATLIVSGWVYDPSAEAAGLPSVLISASRRVLGGDS
jgi:hypothetical protein